VGHEAALHTQVPATQLCPAAQGAPAPQRHWPLAHTLVVAGHTAQLPPSAPQLAVEAPERQAVPEQHPPQVAGSHTQAPLTHFWPAAHGMPAPH